jgi:hypothetical protein
MISEGDGPVRKIAWICLAVLLGLLGFAMVILDPHKHPFLQEVRRITVALEPILVLVSFCAFWMFYQAVRYEAKPLLYVLLSCFVPFAFVWYYVERYKPRKRASVMSN